MQNPFILQILFFVIILSHMIVQGLLFIHAFGLHGFGYTCLTKIINIKKIVRFTMRKSVMHDFRAR